jgi:hypothetical protein
MIITKDNINEFVEPNFQLTMDCSDSNITEIKYIPKNIE